MCHSAVGRFLEGNQGAICIDHISGHLQINPTDYKTVEYILLDPSCSGSGITNRDDHLTSHTTQVWGACYH